MKAKGESMNTNHVYGVLAAMVAVVCLTASVAITHETSPQLGIVVQYEITRVIDGDTVEGKVTIPLKVRLKDIDAPEPNEDGGPEATEFMIKHALGKKAILVVTSQGKTLGSSFSFDRAVGEIWLKDKRLGNMLIEEGLAEKVK